MLTSRKIGITLSGAALVTLALAGCGTSNQATNTGASTNSTGNTTAGQAATDKNKNITIGYINWSEDVAVSYLWQDLLKQKGYNVTLKEMSNAGPMYAGLANGGLSVYLDTWLPITHKKYIDRYKADYVDLGKWYQGKTFEGFVVPTYVKDVNSISDLQTHASEFGGQIVGIGPGAGEMGLAKTAVSKYGLSKMKLVSSSSAAMLTALKQAEAKKKPIVVTLWSPHWAFAAYDLKYLKDPKGIFGKGGWIQAEGNKKWVNNHPTLAGYLKNFKMTPNQLGVLEEDINKASSKEAGVKKWESNNQSVINGWFQ